MKDNILCFSSYKLCKEKKETDTTPVKDISQPPLAPLHEQVSLQILKLRKDLDDLYTLVASL